MWPKLILLLALAAGAISLKPLPRHGKLKALLPKVEPGDEAKYMLPKDAIPSKYDLKLQTYIEKFDENKEESFAYDGTVNITINVPTDTKTITLHSHGTITISSVKLMAENQTALDLNHNFDEETYKLTLTIKDGSNIVAGDYTLEIIYKGMHGDDMHGFYRSYYPKDGKNRWLVTTQFESYDARRAFPCFDEPQYKALYTISVTIHNKIADDGYHVLSNMNIDGTPARDDGAGLTTFKFQESAQPISSYLVAFIVSDFKSSEAATFGNINGHPSKEFRTWGRESYINRNLSDLSQLAGPAALDAMVKLVNVDFAYPKMDQVGIPDFSAGAMENWGLCTYRERMIFFDKSSQTTATYQSNVMVTAHELAHQWFGDYVTLHWWSDIWLNEGFATFFEFHATAEIATKELNTSTWQVIGQMVTDEVQAGALTVDAEPTSRPLTSEAYTPGDIDANFDDVAYSKGGSVIRMWMHTLGKDKFYKGLTTYQNNRGTQNSEPKDLFDAFETVNPSEPLKGHVNEYFSGWHLQPGYPVLKVMRQNETYEINQERFLVNGDKGTNKWFVPISYTTSAAPNFQNTTPTKWLMTDGKAINIEHNNSDWILLNIQESGYYRVHYDNETWLAITETLHTKPETIHEINRAQLIDDALWLARSTNNYLTYDIALNLTNYLVNETNLVPWKAASNGFNFLYGRLATSDSGEKLVSFVSKLLEKRFEELSLTTGSTDSHTTRILRGIIASWSCKLGMEACVDQAVEKFSEEKSALEADVKSVILCTGIRENGEDEWNEVWEMYSKSEDSAEQTMLISTLGCSTDEDILKEYLAKTLNDTVIRKQDKSAVFSSVYNGNPENLNIALDFLSENLTDIAKSYGGLDPLGGLLKGIAPKLGANDDEVAKMKEIRDKINSDATLVGARNSAELAVSIVVSNKAWVDSKEEVINAWLEENSANMGSISVIALLLPVVLAIFTLH